MDNKKILGAQQKEEFKTQINSYNSLDTLFSDYKVELNKKNFFMRVINWLCEVFGGGLATEFAERTASNNKFQTLINNQRNKSNDLQI